MQPLHPIVSTGCILSPYGEPTYPYDASADPLHPIPSTGCIASPCGEPTSPYGATARTLHVVAFAVRRRGCGPPWPQGPPGVFLFGEEPAVDAGAAGGLQSQRVRAGRVCLSKTNQEGGDLRKRTVAKSELRLNSQSDGSSRVSSRGDFTEAATTPLADTEPLASGANSRKRNGTTKKAGEGSSDFPVLHTAGILADEFFMSFSPDDISHDGLAGCSVRVRN